MRFEGKTALVSGGSQGIGEAVALRLAAEGARVGVMASAQLAKAQAVIARLNEPERHLALACDVTDSAAVRTMLAEVLARFGRLDILVNSAGVFYATPAGGTEASAFDRMVDINLKGTWNLVNAAVPAMKAQRGGKIVNLASVAGVMGIGSYAVYCATKAGIIMLTRALVIELAPFGINVNCLAPGNTATPMNAAVRTDPALKHFLDAMAARTPSGRTYSTAEEMAGIVAFLASEEARAMHGSCLLADEAFSAGL
jgi:3-oxoacyl-[acyl-carrier protein] reductase